MQKLSKSEAEERGLSRYFTGKACKYGHVAERYISGDCIPCARVRNRDWHRENSRQRGRPAPTRPQPSVCECCGEGPNGRGGLHLDHDHETGEFRGWLCFRCNTGIGKLGDTPEGVKKALDYLNGCMKRLE